MRFLDFPDWLGRLSLVVDYSWLGDVLIFLSLVHIGLVAVVCIKKIGSLPVRFAVCAVLLELPVLTLLLLYVAGLPKA
uniref:hypothetical protein n=1 Tax=Castellaniella defragrans TaxID=75697 RepID=UPI003342B421